MNAIILILAGISVVTTIISTIVTMRIIKIRKQVNRIILNHNEITHILEEENRVLQSRLLVIPNEIMASIEKVIDENPDINMKDFKEFIKNNNKLYNECDK